MEFQGIAASLIVVILLLIALLFFLYFIKFPDYTAIIYFSYRVLIVSIYVYMCYTVG